MKIKPHQSVDTYVPLSEIERRLHAAWGDRVPNKDREPPMPIADPIEFMFFQYHLSHPDTYRYFVKFAREVRNRRFDTYGCNAVCERIRWHLEIEVAEDSDFKLNSGFVAFYSRIVMLDNPDLFGLFNTRKMHVVSVVDDIWNEVAARTQQAHDEDAVSTKPDAIHTHIPASYGEGARA